MLRIYNQKKKSKMEMRERISNARNAKRRISDYEYAKGVLESVNRFFDDLRVFIEYDVGEFLTTSPGNFRVNDSQSDEEKLSVFMQLMDLVLKLERLDYRSKINLIIAKVSGLETKCKTAMRMSERINAHSTKHRLEDSMERISQVKATLNDLMNYLNAWYNNASEQLQYIVNVSGFNVYGDEMEDTYKAILKRRKG